MSALNIEENVPLAPLTTFGVGGPARYFVRTKTQDEVVEAVTFAAARNLRLFVLGGGSNLVIADSGWPGLVLKLAIGGIEERRQNGNILFDVGAGEDWDSFVAHAVNKDCAGIECLSGIPGTVGGTPVQNVGAYGQEVSDTIDEVVTLNLHSGHVQNLCRESCGFAYRASIFNTTERGNYIVFRVTYRLVPGGDAHVEYADLKKHFGEGTRPTLQQTRQAVRDIRLSKAMLIVPGDDDCRSAGSFFKNPMLSPEGFSALSARAEALGKVVPSYPSRDDPAGGMRKVPAAWLVEQSGMTKGTVRGPVGISRRHALAIVNRGGASAADILALKDEIQLRVRDKFGLELQPEPVFVGFDAV